MPSAYRQASNSQGNWAAWYRQVLKKFNNGTQTDDAIKIAFSIIEFSK
jgi:hypothetical protein